MKTVALLTKKITILFVLLLFYGSGKCQIDKIVELDCFNTDTAIIREWRDGFSLLYGNSISCGPKFYLMDQDGLCHATFSTNCKVKDVEIIADSAYFCGINMIGESLAGFFNINDMLNGTVQEYHVVHQPFLGIPSVPRRIEAFHVSDGVHFILLVDLNYPSDSVKRVLVDIYKRYSDVAWSARGGCYSIFETDNIFYCDDIAVTDKFVFVVGHKRFSDAIYMRKFEKPQFASMLSGSQYDIFQSTSSPNVYDYIYYYAHPFGGNLNVLGDKYGEHSVYCTHTVGDSVAIACMTAYMDPVGINPFSYGVTVKDIDVSSMTLIKDIAMLYAPDTLNKMWDVRDIRYDNVNQNLLLLHELDHPSVDWTIVSAVTFVDYPSLATNISAVPLVAMYQYSVDKLTFSGNEVIVGGRRLDTGENTLVVGMGERNMMSCYQTNVMPVVFWWQSKIGDFPVPVEKKQLQCRQDVYVRNAVDKPTELICY